MKKYLIVLFALIATAGCSQTLFPGKLVWEHDYQTVLHEPIDSTDLDYMIYQSIDLNTPFQLIAVVQSPQSELVMLDSNAVYFPEFYTSETRYFYLVAHWISRNVDSLPSDTTQGDFFPSDRPLKSYDEDVIYNISIGNN